MQVEHDPDGQVVEAGRVLYAGYQGCEAALPVAGVGAGAGVVQGAEHWGQSRLGQGRLG